MPSELQVNTITEATSGSGITFAKDIIAPSALSHRNMIINGGMQVYQRGSLSITQSNNGGFALDRFRFYQDGTVGQWQGTMSQYGMTDPEIVTTGHTMALKVITTTVENAIGADEESRVIYKIEAQDCQRLLYGTSAASSATLSFWAKSTVAGDYAVSIWQTDGNDIIGSKYTLAANTWKKVSITFAGNTLENIANDNTEGLRINFMLIAGGDFTSANNTSWGAYAGNKLAYGHTASWGVNANDAWYITGVQLELGSVSTPFEHRSFAEELTRCERYYQTSFYHNNVPGTSTSNFDSALTTSWTDGNAPFPNPFRTVMRAQPSVTLRPRGLTTTGQVSNGGTARNASAQDIGNKGISYIGVTSGTGGQYNAFTYVLDAELN